MTPTLTPDMKAVFGSFHEPARTGLLHLRSLIFDCAKRDNEVAPITEALRWGQPAYLCKTGSGLRLGIPKTGGFAIYVHCQTSLIRDFTQLFPNDFVIEGNRAVHFQTLSDIDDDKLRFLITSALRYRL